VHPWLWGLCRDAAAAAAPGGPPPPAFCRSKSSTCIDDGRLLAPRPRERAGPLHVFSIPLFANFSRGAHLQHVMLSMQVLTTASAQHQAPY
jgi:hypothetical protein